MHNETRTSEMMGFRATALASCAWALMLAAAAVAQTVAPVAPEAPVVGQVAAPTSAATDSAAGAAQDAAAARLEEQQEKALREQQEAVEDATEDAREKAEKDARKAAEEQAEAQRKAAEAQAKQAAAANAAAPVAAAAPGVPAAAGAAPVAASAPLPKDPRDRVVQVCMNEAKQRGAAIGAAGVSMREVKDTDVKSDGRASVIAEVNLVTKDRNGKIKASKKKFECQTRNDVVTSFKMK